MSEVMRNPNFDILGEEIVQKNSQELLLILDNLKEKLENETFTIDEIENMNPEDRGYPQYLPGTFDKYGVPLDEKLKNAYDNIVLGLCKVNIFEGGVRGGKDVLAIALFTELLMIHPARDYLVLGHSLEHAIKTVFDSNGFGLFNTIPHGKLTREQIDGAQRVVYRFKDYNGIDKKILVYGNSQRNDFEKFQGFTIGATYISEGTNQVIKGLREALQRMITSILPVMVVTQNPVGSMNEFYTDFEKSFLPKPEMIGAIEAIQNAYRDTFEEIQSELYIEMKKEVIKKKKEFLSKRGVPDLNSLTETYQVQWNKIERDVRMIYEKHLRDLKVGDVIKSGLPTSNDLYTLSLKKVMYYKRAFPNPNGIENNIDYAYYHVTLQDNKALTEMQKNEAMRMFPKGSSLYDQRILGIRKTIDKAVLDNFNEEAIFDFDVNVFKEMTTERVIVIDFGAGKATGIADYELDFSTGDLWQTREEHLTPDKLKAIGKSITEQTVYEYYLKVLKKGKKNATLIIDSANKHLINFFEDIKGIPVILANKKYNMPNNNDQSEGFQRVDNAIIGIDLMKLGFDLKKIHIHRTCTESINELESYEFSPENEKSGKIEVIKVRDEFCDTLRYVLNTMFGGAIYWYNDKGEVIDNEQKTISNDEDRENEQRHLEAYERIKQRNEKRSRSPEESRYRDFSSEFKRNF